MESSTDPDLWQKTFQVVKECVHPIVTTSSASGEPHATWMSAVYSDSLSEILTITSPDSLKVKNVKETGKAEWMFTSDNKRHVVYLSGKTEVVEDVVRIKQYWDLIPEKQHAFFLGFYNSGIGFAIVRTEVDDVVLCEPREFKKVRVESPG